MTDYGTPWPTEFNRYRARNGLYYPGYMASPDAAEDCFGECFEEIAEKLAEDIARRVSGGGDE